MNLKSRRYNLSVHRNDSLGLQLFYIKTPLPQANTINFVNAANTAVASVSGLFRGVESDHQLEELFRFFLLPDIKILLSQRLGSCRHINIFWIYFTRSFAHINKIQGFVLLSPIQFNLFTITKRYVFFFQQKAGICEDLYFFVKSRILIKILSLKTLNEIVADLVNPHFLNHMSSSSTSVSFYE